MGPEGEAYFCDVCQDNPKRCDKQSCPGAPHPDDPHTQAKERAMTADKAHTYDLDMVPRANAALADPNCSKREGDIARSFLAVSAELRAARERIEAMRFALHEKAISGHFLHGNNERSRQCNLCFERGPELETINHKPTCVLATLSQGES